ncbi:MAG TPA: type II toxin-antitoxin system VapB family antitoxin [Rugosimonospora sp.]|nr:type II toxin-antitoxin system VapB family antitoxin [Rugosimonospora sp.]
MTETMVKKEAGTQIDEELLEEARRQLGNVSPEEAINQALHELVENRRDRRGRAYDNLQRIADQGELDFDAIAEADR